MSRTGLIVYQVINFASPEEGEGGSTLISPRGSAIVASRWFDVGLTAEAATARAERALRKAGARTVRTLRVFRDHEVEVRSEQLTRELLSYVSSPF